MKGPSRQKLICCFFKAVDFVLTKLSLIPIQKTNYSICQHQFNLANSNLSKHILSDIIYKFIFILSGSITIKIICFPESFAASHNLSEADSRKPDWELCEVQDGTLKHPSLCRSPRCPPFAKSSKSSLAHFCTVSLFHLHQCLDCRCV